MSQTIPLRIQQNGSCVGWESITGTVFGWQAIDDSDSTTHDGDDTYLVLPRQILPAGRISFPFFLQCQPGQPISVSLTVGAKIHSGSPVLQIGFYRGGQVGFHGTTFTPTGSYSTATRSFTTDPITGGAWTAALLSRLEACVQMDAVIGKARITLLSGSLVTAANTNAFRRGQDRALVA